jgi:RHS repeat-associated protein
MSDPTLPVPKFSPRIYLPGVSKSLFRVRSVFVLDGIAVAWGRSRLPEHRTLARSRLTVVALALPILVLATAGLSPRLFAQDGPDGDVPDDPSNPMTIEPTDSLVPDPPDQDIPGDPTIPLPQAPYSPDTPATGSDYEGPVGVTGIFNGNVATGSSYDPLSHSAKRTIDDIVVPGSVGKYPLKMTRYYNSRAQYYALTAIGLGPGWAHEYSWLVWSGGSKVISPQGNVYDSYCGPPVGVSEGWESHSGLSGTWRLADGGRVRFDNGRASYIEDPYGLRTTIEYVNGQRTKVTEPGGRYLQFFYGPDTDPDGTVLLHKIEAHGLGTATVTDWVFYSYTSKPAGAAGRTKMMLTGVTYSDGTSATYGYRTDNVTEIAGTSYKMYPLLATCNDVRYNGPMRQINYQYETLDTPNSAPHGAIRGENYNANTTVSRIDPALPSITVRTNPLRTFTETRADGPIRTFTYTPFIRVQDPEAGPCDDVQNNNPPHQMLDHYTDFRGHTTMLGYDSNWYINSVTDANNHTTTYNRGLPPPNGIGQITRITHPDTTYIQYTYQSEPSPAFPGHYLASIRNERGKITSLIRDPDTHRITRIDYRDGNNALLAYETFDYNDFGQVTRHRLKNGAYVHFQYDARGLLLKRWNPTITAFYPPPYSEPHTIYTYYTSGAWTDRVKKMTLPANVNGYQATETYEYDRTAPPSGAACAGRGLVTKITHADGKYQSFGYSQFGNKMWEENEKRQRTSYTYDYYNRVLAVTNPLYKTETFSYLEPGTSSSYFYTTDSVYTHTSRTGIETTNVYDENWRKTSTTVSLATTSFVYDDVGNLTQVTDPRSRVTVNMYDVRNRKTRTTEAYGTNLATTTVWHYDGASNINQIDHPYGISETKGFDALNRMVRDSVPRQVPNHESTTVTTRFDYNPSGTIRKVTDPNGHWVTFDYDASDQKTQMNYQNGQSQSWAYDNAHNLKSRTTVGNKTQNFTYDNRNRKTGMTWTNGADSGSFTYDDAGRLLTASNPNSTVTRTYDAAGRLTVDQQAVNGLSGARTANYWYDEDGKQVRMCVSSASYDYTFSYDAMGRFEKISPTGSSVAFQYYYDPASNETQRMNFLNGVTQLTPRDSLNRIARRDVKKGGNWLSAEAYTYDRMSRLTEVNRGSVYDWYGYYWDGELESAQYGVHTETPVEEGADPDTDTTDNVDPWANYQSPQDAEAEPTLPPDTALPDPAPGDMAQPDVAGMRRWVSYFLDKAGNRTNVVDTGVWKNYAVNTLNQYTTAESSSVGNGSEHEVASYQNVSYTYINDERLKQATSGGNTYSLAYDALGRCVKRTLNVGQSSVTTYYIYDGEKPVLEYRSDDLTHPARNLYGKGIDEILMRTDPTVNSGQTFYYQHNHEGSVTHLTNASGNVIEKYTYDAFGAPTMYDANGNQIDHSGYNNRFLFTGREYAATYAGTYTPAFTFYEYRARAYNPTLGRFMSEDPKGFDAGDYNLFRYCHNDPLDLTDPMGTDPTYQAAAPDHGWDMAKWADRSNNLQLTFQVWMSLNAQRDLTMGQAGVGQRISVERAIPINGQRDPLLDRGTEDRLATLQQPVRDMARSLIYHSRVELQLDVRIVPQGAFRSYAEQNDLHARGISPARGGQSFHNFGVAFDIGTFEGRRYIENGPGYTAAGRLGERLGLEWGGSWSPRRQDPPHFQYLGGQTMSQIRARFEQGLSPIPGY